jgi:hypothetical protein
MFQEISWNSSLRSIKHAGRVGIIILGTGEVTSGVQWDSVFNIGRPKGYRLLPNGQPAWPEDGRKRIVVERDNRHDHMIRGDLTIELNGLMSVGRIRERDYFMD